MNGFQLPEDLTSLGHDELQSLLDQAVAEFDEKSGADSITGEDLAALRKLRDDINAIKTEQNARIAEAEEAAAEIQALQNEIHGESDPDADPGEGGDGGGDPSADPEDPSADPDVEPEEQVDPDAELEPELVSAGARPLNMAAIRRRQPAQRLPEPDPEPPRPGVVITAAADVPGFAIGQAIDMDALIAGTTARASGLASAKRPAQAYIASYKLPFPDELIVDDAGSAPAGSRAAMVAADQSRLPGGDLVASGGWCAPSETVYEIADIACPEMLWTAPEIQLRRGGIRFFQTPSLDISSLTWIHTEAADIAGAEKPCFTIPCPDPIEVRCDAVGVCLESGILTEKFFPELTGWYLRNSMVAHEIRISQALYLEAVAASTAITVDETFGAFSAVFAQVALQAADIVEKHSLCDSIAVEVTFPWWARNAFLADIARQNGTSVDEIDPGVIDRAFATLGVRVQYARSLPDQVPSEIGGTNPAAGWPSTVPFMLHPAGAFEIGRGAEVNLGAIYDSEKFKTNDFTALFTEECVALVNRGPESRYVTVPICPDGITAGQITDVTCPIDNGTVES